MSSPIQNRYEFVYFFDVENGNPNGDPDAGNMPRVDPETNYGIVTDVCLKRKIRNYVDLIKKNESPFEIHVRENNFLSNNHKRAHKAVENEDIKDIVPAKLIDEITKIASKLSQYFEVIKSGDRTMYLSYKLLSDKKEVEKEIKKLKPSEEAAEFIQLLLKFSMEELAKKWMCKNFFDVRSFGAVMSTGDKRCGQVRGPVQLNFARSIVPIYPLNISMSRTAAVNEDDPDDKGLGASKHIVPYALYRAEGYVSAHLADQTGFSDNDLQLLWDALINMFDHDHSAARGKMNTRKLVVFKHDSALGKAQSHKLFSLVNVKRTDDETKPARAFTYDISIDEANVPQGVTLEIKL